MAGTIPLSLTQQIDKDTMLPLRGGRLYIFAAGTTTPQVAYQDLALTLPVPGGSIISLDAAGRLPQFFLADGGVKVRLTNSVGVTQFVADSVLVTGPSNGGGGGGGGSVDPTTVLSTGDIKIKYGLGSFPGFVRGNGRTIGSASSGASERSNADTQALFEYLWTVPALAVSGGRGATANSDWVANKSIELPDFRGRSLVGLDDMGSTSSGRLTSTYFGSNPLILGATGGSQTSQLLPANLPPYTPAGNVIVKDGGGVVQTQTKDSVSEPSSKNQRADNGGGGSTNYWFGSGADNVRAYYSYEFSGTAQGGSSALFANLPPGALVTFYIKL